MNKLLKKEWLLCTNPQLITFCLLGTLVCIPSWPSMVAIIYVLSGLATIFPRSVADHDTQYTAMLPIRKKDVVAGKVTFVAFLELASLLVSVPFALLKIFVFDPSAIAAAEAISDASTISYTLAVQPSLGGYGYALLAFGVFNVILFPWYYKNTARVNWPPMVAFFVAFFVLGLGIAGEAVVATIFQGDRSNGFYWLNEILAGSLGLLLFVLLSFFGIKKAQINFEKVDL